MKKNNVKQFKVSPLSIMKELGDRIETDKFLPDEDFWDDRLYWMKKNYNSDVDRYKSKNTKDKERIFYYDLETVNQLINQILRFGRIVMSNENGVVYNFPKGEIPKFIVDLDGSQKTNTIEENMRINK